MLDQLSELQTSGKPDLVRCVITLYLNESPKLIRGLRQAAHASDAAEMSRAAHSLKSSSASVGATALSRLCADVEAAARGAAADEAGMIVARVEREHGRVQTALAEELEQAAA